VEIAAAVPSGEQLQDQCHETIDDKFLPGTVHGTVGSCNVKTIAQSSYKGFIISFYPSNLPANTLPMSILPLSPVFGGWYPHTPLTGHLALHHPQKCSQDTFILTSPCLQPNKPAGLYE